MKQLSAIVLCISFLFAQPAQSDDVNNFGAIEKPDVTWVSEKDNEPPKIEDVPIDEHATPKYLLEKVVIKGNRKTLDQVILRYVEVKPGEIFSVDDIRLLEAKYRLQATGLFSQVALTLERGQRRGFAILRVTVKERNTIVVQDINFGLTRIAPHWDKVTPFGSIGVAENSFLGTGIVLSGAVAAGEDQIAYRITMQDDHFLNSKMGLRVEGLYASAQETFGNHFLPGPEDEEADFGRYAQLDYKRASLKLGTGYNLILDYHFWFDLRFESILAEEPTVVEVPGDESGTGDPAAVPYWDPDDSILTSFLFGVTRDTRDHPLLPSEGARTQFSAELSHPTLGSDYEFAKFTIGHDNYFPFGQRRHSIKLGFYLGLITGNAPFFDQFFVGDYSAFAPSRILGINFSNLHPNVLDTSIKDMWYEDLVATINLEYAIPIYRGSGFVYGIDGFIGTGVLSLTSSQDIGNGSFPIDITADFGVRIDTSVGIFALSFANVLQLIPPIRRETTE